MAKFDPEARLKKLTKQLDRERKTIAAKEQKAADLDAEAAEPRGVTEELRQCCAEYEQFEKRAKAEHDRVESFCKKNTQSIKKKLRAKGAARVLQVRNKHEKSIESTSERVKAAERNFKEAEARLEEVSGEHSHKQSEYEKFQAYTSRLEAGLQELKDLQERIEQEEERSNLSRAYFLLTELEKKLSELSVSAPLTYKSDLTRARQELTKAKNAQNEAERELGRAKDKHERASEEYAAKLSRKREEILMMLR